MGSFSGNPLGAWLVGSGGVEDGGGAVVGQEAIMSVEAMEHSRVHTERKG